MLFPFDKFFMQSFGRRYIDNKIVETLLVLVLKQNNLTKFKNFRFVSVCNVFFEVIVEVLVNRIRSFLDDLIDPFQSSFILRRGTIDNVILIQKVVHHMHIFRSKKGMLTFKIDLKKANDRLDYKFLELTLKDFNFLVFIISLIINCVKATTLSIMQNGATTNKSKSSRALQQGDPLFPQKKKQGDPLSLYLFVL